MYVMIALMNFVMHLVYMGVDEICSLCESNSDTELYEVDGQSYYVCYGCYEEFAHAFGLEGAPEDVPLEEDSASVCSLCEVAKECGTYEVNGEYYVVCDNCYGEFAYAFGLNEGAEEERICGLCEATSDTERYEVDGQYYDVCPYCYNEFATAFGLN